MRKANVGWLGVEHLAQLIVIAIETVQRVDQLFTRHVVTCWPLVVVKHAELTDLAVWEQIRARAIGVCAPHAAHRSRLPRLLRDLRQLLCARTEPYVGHREVFGRFCTGEGETEQLANAAMPAIACDHIARRECRRTAMLFSCCSIPFRLQPRRRSPPRSRSRRSRICSRRACGSTI